MPSPKPLPPPLFQFCWFQDKDKSLDELAALAMPEDWNYKISPSAGKHPILFNYLHHTFRKIQEEGKIIIDGDYASFNTGLVTEHQEEIFAFLNKNNRPSSKIPWFFIGYRKESDRDLMKFSNLPERANYFNEPSELIFDTRLDIRLNVEHIIDDNIARFPAPFNTYDRHHLGILLRGAIDDIKKRVKRNYKTAIPQYFGGKLQLLLPLCLTNKSIADLALVVERENDLYRVTTCLTLDMAMNNARLIAKPDDEWLKP